MADRRSELEVPIGLLLGIVVALVFALVIAAVPEAWFVDRGRRVALYAAQVPAALLFVLLARLIAMGRSMAERPLLLWMVVGALVTDGLALGFWPALYGHAPDVLASVASTLLWAFGWIVAAGLAFTRGPDPTPRV